VSYVLLAIAIAVSLVLAKVSVRLVVGLMMLKRIEQ
jgi:hypothetical protein